MSKKLKVEILNILSKSMSPYTATQWLKKPLADFNNEVPSEIFKKNNKKEMAKLLKIIKEEKDK
tara:strand:- start:1047 stop:1238 length:192 start_codon:yes stop_codon:yes gene_type:complete